MRKWLNQVAVAAAVKAEVVEVSAGLPKRRVKNLVRAEIMLHKDAND